VRDVLLDIAITEGSNYNDPRTLNAKEAATAAQEAVRLSGGAKPAERR
jgi:hypothetical protein